MDKKTKNQSEKQPPVLLFKGETVDAEYQHQIIAEFRNNPLIEALPEILSPEELVEKLTYSPDYSPQLRDLDAKYRLHLLENAREFFLPLSRDIELYYAISNMIRRSYIHRNPLLNRYYGALNQKIEKLNEEVKKPPRSISLRSRARGATVFGAGGTGKSSSIENALLLLPQVIIHKKYKEQDLILKQLAWLKIDSPQDGSPRGLCLAFFSAVDEMLGTSYLTHYNKSRSTINDLLLSMARVAAIHCLGVLVIDEIQDLSQAKSGGEIHLLNFFVHLENSIGVPFILIGTPKALPLFKGEFRQARRASEQGDFLWKRLEMLSDFDPKQPHPQWSRFVRQMWYYQYVRKAKLLPDNILDEPTTRILYNESQGIIAVALTIFFLTQKRAILSGLEEISADVMKSAVKDNQNLIKNMIDSFRLGLKKTVHGETDFESLHFRVDRKPKDTSENDVTFSTVHSAPEDKQITVDSEEFSAGKTVSRKKKVKRTGKSINCNAVSLTLDQDQLNTLDTANIKSYIKSSDDLR